MSCWPIPRCRPRRTGPRAACCPPRPAAPTAAPGGGSAGPGTRPQAERQEAAYHEARKAAKRARYAGEAVSPALGQDARRFTKQMKKIQSVLGDHQDAMVARGVDRELGIGAHLAGENAFTFGLLYEREDQRAARLRAEAQRTWKRAPQPRFGRWSS